MLSSRRRTSRQRATGEKTWPGRPDIPRLPPRRDPGASPTGVPAGRRSLARSDGTPGGLATRAGGLSSRSTASAHDSTECPASTRRRSSSPAAARTCGTGGGRPRARPAPDLSGSRRAKRSSSGRSAEKLVQCDVAREHRQPSGARLVDDLVERLAPLRLCRAEEHIGVREKRGDRVTRDGRLEHARAPEVRSWPRRSAEARPDAPARHS